MSDLLEQFAIFLEVCGEFHPVYMELRKKYQEMGAERGGDFSSLRSEEDLERIVWVDFPVAHECDLDSLYDSIREMLKYRIFNLGRENLLMDFLERSIEMYN